MTGVTAANLTGSNVEQYEVVSQLGGGGMGVVYEGRAPDGQRVAIKTLKPAFAADEEVVGRFLAEARALKELQHNALVKIFSIGQLDDGTHYYVMEFLEGKTFEDVISHQAPLEPREVMSWMCEVLDALEVVHAHGVVHRDLKPSNLFLARTGVGAQVKLIDFGVAKHSGASQRASHKTAVSAIVGTPDYMSPEQVNGGEVTGASDLYALGCVMFEMLTGQLPFTDDSEVKKMMMHIEQPAPAPSSLVPTLPKDVDDIVKWMLQKDPTQRPPSAIALKRRVETVIAELGGTGHFATQQIPAVTLVGEVPSMTLDASPPYADLKTMLDQELPDRRLSGRRTRETLAKSSGGFRVWWLAPIAVLVVLASLAVWKVVRRRAAAPAVVTAPAQAPLPKAAEDRPPVSPPATAEPAPTAEPETPAPPPPTPVKHTHPKTSTTRKKPRPSGHK